jgi:MarR family 2-MHQ and catechol resistance regulon transcriptional repressor
MGTRFTGTPEETRALNTFIKLMKCASSVTEKLEQGNPLPDNLTLSQFEILQALLHEEPLCQQELSSKILKTKSNITFVLDNMEKSLLVQRVRNTENRKYVQVFLTDKGRKLIQDFFPDRVAMIVKIMNALTAEEQEIFQKLLKKLGVS